MADIRKMAEELLTLGAVRDAINVEYRRMHSALQGEYVALGLERQRITMADGVELGTVVLANGAIIVEIIDRDAMLEWLEEKHPTEMTSKTVYDINAAYWRVLVEAAKAAGVGVDPETGERLDWIKVSVGDKTLRATATGEAKSRVKDLLNNQGLRLELDVK